MDVFEAIMSRESIRRYSDEQVPRTLLLRLLEAARWAPSTGNCQPWRFVVVSERTSVRLIRDFSPGFAFEAPVLIVICWEKDTKSPGVAREHLRSANCYLAAQNICLAACEVGLGTCMIGSFSPAAVAEILSLPDDVYPELIMALGYPQQQPSKRSRLPLTELVHFECWSDA